MTKVANTATVQQAPDFIGSFRIGDLEFQCLRGTGVHFNKTTEMIQGKMSMFYPTLAHLLLRLPDGSQMAPKEYEDLSWADYKQLLNELVKLGFTLD